MPLGGMELLIILLIVVVLFGAGRISRLGGELGSGMREFRHGLQAEKTEDAAPDQSTDASAPKSR
jgi:sec-independent protein translocase protein TatA